MRDIDGIASPGLLSPLLARLRHRRAESLIPRAHGGGRILDVGCGTWPAFLMRTRFAEKHGLDRRAPSNRPAPGVVVRQHDIEREALPYADGYFDVVTLLAVVEHLGAEHAVTVLREVRRVLREGGVAVLTLPSAQGEALLPALSRLRLTSAEHHHEHQCVYDPERLRSLLGRAGFASSCMAVGRFELGFSLWARAVKGLVDGGAPGGPSTAAVAASRRP
jgi:SAM-dependent methyltransferase